MSNKSGLEYHPVYAPGKLMSTFVVAIFILFFFLQNTSAQTLLLKGIVRDEANGEALPFVNLQIKGTLTGTASDSLGHFQLRIQAGRRRDTLLASALGYEPAYLAIAALADQFITIELKPTAVNLREAVIKPGENPAFRILRKVVAAKAQNNPANLNALEYESYHKVEFDMNNFTEKIKKNIFLRSFNFIFDNADTTADGVNYLPILLTESTSKVYERKNPPTHKELVLGRKSVGLKGPKIMKFAEDMYLAPDIYSDFVVILDKNFPSPIIDNFKNFYRYYLIDSLSIGGHKNYYIQFKPKHKEDLAFTGEMYILDSSFAISRIDFSFSINANVNFVRNYWIRQDFAELQPGHFLLNKSQVIGDFTVVENSKEMTGFFGRNTSSYRNYKINEPLADNFYSGLDRLTFDDSASIQTESFWEQVRSEELSQQEKSIVGMIDTLEKQPKFRLLKNTVKSVSSGWIPLGKLDVGDFYSFYSYNSIEKSRVKLGLRAQHLLNDRLNFKTYLAYGTADQRWKYLMESRWIVMRNRSRETRIGGKMRYDALQPGRSSTIFALDHVLNSFSNLGSFRQRALVKEYEGFVERQWISGFTSRISFNQSQWTLFDQTNFELKLNQQLKVLKKDFRYTALRLELRYAFSQRNLIADFGEGFRASALPQVPVISLRYEHALDNFALGEFNADKLKIRLDEKLRMRKFGYSIIRLEAGKVWGTLPYTFLESPTANPLLFGDETAFNMMNYLEFISDQYLSLMVEQHFDGLLFNRIPLLKKLKWRELLLAKVYAGSLATANKNSIYALPNGTSNLTTPYIEVGCGIENILKFSRVDFLWRLTYRDIPGYYNFIAKPLIQFKF